MTNLIPIEQQNQRVLLTNQLAEQYETTSKVISNNFNNNKDRYQEGKHYYHLEGQYLLEFLQSSNLGLQNQDKIRSLYLWTEKGALLHAKSLNTDKAWEVYDTLVETYFNVRQNKPACIEDVLIQSLQEMKDMRLQLQNTNKRIDGIRDVVALDTNSWRPDARNLIVRIAQKMGGNEYIKDVNAEVFKLVDERAGISLATRLTNKRRRMADEGVCKSKRDKLTKVDIIAEDKKAIEIYVAIVKEMAIKYGVEK